MGDAPEKIWIEADDECPYFYEAHELHDVEQDVIEYVRADIYAALEAQLAARTGAVKAAWLIGRRSYAPAFVLEDDDRTEREWEKAKAELSALGPAAPEGQQEPVAVDGYELAETVNGEIVRVRRASNSLKEPVTGPDEVAALQKALSTAEDHAGTLPAREAVKLRPTDWHALAAAIRSVKGGRNV